MRYILSHPRLTASAKLLAEKIQELTGEKLSIKTDFDDNRNNRCVIRFGNSQRGFVDDTKYNSPEMIRLAGNKLRLSTILQEREFPHVIFMRRVPEENEFPIVARDELNRGGGIGIRILEDMDEFENGNPVLDWTPWYNFKFELGVHILGGQIVKVFKKVRDDTLDEEKFPIRNTQRGYSFSLRPNWETIYTGLKPFVKKLYEIVPIQFARLDVGYDKSTGGYRLIEINSAPDLTQNKNTLSMYAAFLVKEILNG